MTIHKCDLQAVFSRLCDDFKTAGVDTSGWTLSTWSPGDGCTRYRVESNAMPPHPLGGWQWLGAKEAYYGIQTACAAVELVLRARAA